jgi:hypothetical protein
MLKAFLISIAAASFAIALHAQTRGESSSASTQAKPDALTGCIVSPQPGTFVVKDDKKGTFALLGRRLDIYIGKRVEVQSDHPGGLHITTGLYPSPNVAAQAGAIDPVQAAQAAMPGGANQGTNPAALPTFTVAKVKTVKGACK